MNSFNDLKKINWFICDFTFISHYPEKGVELTENELGGVGRTKKREELWGGNGIKGKNGGKKREEKKRETEYLIFDPFLILRSKFLSRYFSNVPKMPAVVILR